MHKSKPSVLVCPRIRVPERNSSDMRTGRRRGGGHGDHHLQIIYEIESWAEVRNADEGASGLRAAESGAKFSAVCARCTSGRGRAPSIAVGEVGGGGRGKFGGGTGGGLRSVRRDLKNAKRHRRHQHGR
jgi:hypothetical protein